ncbi:MAG: hypothetical protein IJY09_09610 [Lachnospiraceae bacterium]|nr:hypothetical protein [Lachnospiraceae bacterium]
MLPNYIEDLCSEETKPSVAAHLEECESCAVKYKEMKGELPGGWAAENKELLVEELQPMKKIRKRHGLQLAFMAMAMLVVVVGAGWSILHGNKEEYNAGYDTGYDEGNEEGYHAGYNEGSSKGYSVGYDEGSSEGYSAGYSEGYDEANKADENLLTLKVKTDSAGEIFAELAAKMQEKWNAGDELYVVWDRGEYGCSIRDLKLWLMDEEVIYRINSYYAYREEVLTVEVRRLERKQLVLQQPSSLEKLFRWSVLVDCMKMLDYNIADDSRDIAFIFELNEALKVYPYLLVGGEKAEEEWLYENGELKRCEEELQLEGDGKYYYLLLLTMHSVRTEDGSWTVEIPEAKGIYINMK